MLQYWKAQKQAITTIAKDTKTFSLHVLSSAGFGKAYTFQSSGKSAENDSSTYKDSLSLILENAILILVLGPKLLSNSLLQKVFPAHWKKVGQATVNFKAYMTDTYEL